MTAEIEKIDETRSPTFSGETTPCALWRKLKPKK
jgi:hypothetical protein